MSQATQAIAFNGVPLLCLAAAYLGVTASVAPELWRERRRLELVEIVPMLVFPSVGVAAAIWGGVVLTLERPVAGHVWLSLAGLLVALLPAVVLALRWRERRSVATGAVLAREARERNSLRDRELETVSRLSNELARTHAVEDVARVFLGEVVGLFGLGFAGLSLLSEDETEARGLLALKDGKEWEWWPGVLTELTEEASGIASAVYEASPLALYDVEASSRVSPGLVAAVGAKSAAFVPLIAGERVLGVLSVATTDERRAFAGEELALLQALAAEAATALDRARSTVALGQALERERLVTAISRRLRSDLDLDTVLRVAVEETGPALGASRCLVCLQSPGDELPIAAEWHAAGLRPLRDSVDASPISIRAAAELRTIAVPDLRSVEGEGVGALVELGSRAVLATPLLALNEPLGAFALHRAEPGPWSEDDVLLAEAVAHEVALALHVGRLLEQNRVRIGQQGALLRAAQVLSGDLDLASVLQRLAGQVAELLDADAADCYLYDRDRDVLRCAAVHGLPSELVGFEFSAGTGLVAAAMRAGRPAIATSHDELQERVPHEAYAGFTEVAVAPMRWNEEVQGVLGVGLRGGARSFGRSDAEVLEAFAGLASLALRNAETFSRSARQARVQRGFYRIASVLGQSLSRAATLDAVGKAAAETLGGRSAAVLMPTAGVLELAGSFELPEELASLLRRGVPEQTALGRAAAERRVLAASSVAEDDRFPDDWRDPGASTSGMSLLSIPVDMSRHPAGGLVVVFFPDRHAFTDDDLELARHLVDAARGALERSDLYESERTSRMLAQQLAYTGGLLATELDPAAVLDEVVQEAPKLLAADACAIRVLEDDALIVSAVAGEGAEEAAGSRGAVGPWLSGEVVQSRAPVAVEDVRADRRLHELDPMLAAGHRSFLGVPLVGSEGALRGVLAVYGRDQRSWQPEEVEALRALAANTSAALSNAELYQRVALERERSFAILANIADGIVAVDRDGRVVLWNAAAEHITGVPAAEAVGRTTAQVLQRALESEGVGQLGDRLVSIRRNGEEIWLSLTEAVMRDPAGAIAGRVFAFRDISADRLVEQMKSDFVSAVSHELRTPLTSIYGFAETLLRQDVLFGDEERRLFLGYIASESQRLTAIVDALLNVARLDTGDLQVSLAPTDVREIVSEVVAGARGGNGHTFVVDLPSERLDAEADREKLRQVFSILLDNAVKYSPEGGTVTVGAARKRESIEVRVVDEGPGIPQAEQERIFRKFYRGGDVGGRVAEVGGTGLGLFIARGLVAAMGGSIWVTSNEGRGSSFGFELPLAQATGGNDEFGAEARRT